MTTKPPEIHGHRGARGLYPENTLASIRAGIDCGCDAIEVDLCVSADNQLVIHHDPILSSRLVRDKTGQWIQNGLRIRDWPVEELKKFDVGRINPESDYAKLFPQQTPVDGARIPTLGEFVDLVTNIQSES